jgi:uncharacterized membrane protein
MGTKSVGREPAAGKHERHDACAVCGKSFARRELHPSFSIRPEISKLISADCAEWGDGKFICSPDLARYRRKYVETLLEDERGELSTLERQVLDTIHEGGVVSQNPEDLIAERATFGTMLADRVASFGGSWTFILSFVGIVIVWMLLNVTGWLFRPFDVYPFILLNLALSCLAAIQAPLILMSQKRQEAKDRIRAENDYMVNLKAELEIRQLHEKIDHQLARQWERLAEIQKIQIEMLEEQSGRK